MKLSTILLAAFVVVAFVLLLLPHQARAQSAPLTEEQASTLQSMTAQAFIDWGHPDPIRVVWGTLPGKAIAGMMKSESYCKGMVNNNPEMPNYFWEFPADYQQKTITHEVGHCLGLDHPEKGDYRPSIMGIVSYGITEVDRENYKALWPSVVAQSRPYMFRVTVGMIAQ